MRSTPNCVCANCTFLRKLHGYGRVTVMMARTQFREDLTLPPDEFAINMDFYSTVPVEQYDTYFN